MLRSISYVASVQCLVSPSASRSGKRRCYPLRVERSVERESGFAKHPNNMFNPAPFAEATLVNELQKAAATKEAEIQGLKAKLDANKIAQKLAITEAVSAVEKERNELKNGLERAVLEKNLAEKSLKERYEVQIKEREEQIERLRDLKAKLSTKMVGETLEQHCEIEFNRIRATAFPRAYFEKDNDARSGSKGDYIFRDLELIRK